MLNTCTFLVEDFQKEQNRIDFDPQNEILISFVIKNAQDLRRVTIELVYQSVSFHKKTPFSLYLDFENDEQCDSFYEELKKDESRMFLMFFHPNYKIIQEKPLVFLNSRMNGQKRGAAVLETIHTHVTAQGFEKIEYVWLTERKDSGNINTTPILAQEEISMYSNWLREKRYSSRYLVIRSGNVTKDLNHIQEIEKQFEKEFPEVYNQLKEIRQLQESLQETQQVLKYTAIQLKDQKTYLDLFRQQDEANKINQFYYNEYEVLPLWYKRLGHVIKVLTGKRSLRSLYNSNVKKYKS